MLLNNTYDYTIVQLIIVYYTTYEYAIADKFEMWLATKFKKLPRENEKAQQPNERTYSDTTRTTEMSHTVPPVTTQEIKIIRCV